MKRKEAKIMNLSDETNVTNDELTYSKTSPKGGAYGYVRNSRRRPDSITEDVNYITQWCRINEWLLATVFTDVAVSSNRRERPGFTALCDVLRLHSDHVVIVVSWAHLSRNRTLREYFSQEIQATGAQLIVLNDCATN